MVTRRAEDIADEVGVSAVGHQYERICLQGLARFPSRELVAEESGEIVASVDVVLDVPGHLIALKQIHPGAGIMRVATEDHPRRNVVVMIKRKVVGKDRP